SGGQRGVAVALPDSTAPLTRSPRCGPEVRFESIIPSRPPRVRHLVPRYFRVADPANFALLWAAGIRASETTHGNWSEQCLKRATTKPPSGHAEHHERHIIVLGSACGKRLCGGQDSPHAFLSWKPMTRFGEFDQSLFAPF